MRMLAPRRAGLAACLTALLGSAAGAAGIDSARLVVPTRIAHDAEAADALTVARSQPSDSLGPQALLAGSGGTWSDFPPPPGWFRIPPWRQDAAVIHDSHRGRMIVLGGGSTGMLNDVWALTLGETPYWEALSPAGAAPAPRRLHSAIYDPVRQRVLMFGGYDGSFFGDLWELNLEGPPAWRRLQPAGPAPPARADFAMIYDPSADRVVVFGGYDGVSPGGRRNDVWELSLSGACAWSEITPATGPTARSGHRALMDTATGRMIVFGGYDTAYRNEVWALSLTGAPEWHMLLPEAGLVPVPRDGQSWVYDPARHRAILFGGSNNTTWYSESWEFDLGSNSWRYLPLSNAPFPRRGQAMIYDPVADQLVMFSGFAHTGKVVDTWSAPMAEPSAWRRIALPLSPGLRSRHAAVLDDRRNRMLVFGGTDGGTIYHGETWELSLGGISRWTPVAEASDPARMIRVYPGAAYDPVGDRMVMFGGLSGIAGLLNDVWILSLADDVRWNRATPAGPAPVRRMQFTMVYDPVGRRAILFGGNRGQLNPGSERGDVWALSIGSVLSWQELSPPDGPTPRWGSAAIIDPIRNRMLVFGGYGATYLDEVWSLSLSGTPRWTRIPTRGAGPSARWGHSAAYDPARDRMLVFAGTDATGILTDLWSLSLEDHTWTALSPDGPAPRRRFNHVASFDVSGDRMVVHGGESAHPFEIHSDAFVYAPVPAELMDLTLPGSLNLNSSGHWVTAWLQLPAGIGAEEIDRSSIRFFGNLPGSAPLAADPAAPSAIGDRNGDQVPDLMVKFDRSAVALTLGEGPVAPVTVTAMAAGTLFRGTSSLRVLRAPNATPAGSGSPRTEGTEASPATFALHGVIPNPGHGALTVSFSLPYRGPARLDVMDLAGRRVAAQDLGMAGPGRQQAKLRERLRPGVYVVSLQWAGRSLSVRAVVLD